MSWSVEVTGDLYAIVDAFVVESRNAERNGMSDDELADIYRTRECVVEVVEEHGDEHDPKGPHFRVSASGHWSTTSESSEFVRVSMTVERVATSTEEEGSGG